MKIDEMVYDLRRLISFNNTFNLMGIIFVIRNNLGTDYPCAQTLKTRNLIRAIWTSAKHAFTGGLNPIQSLLCFAIITLTLPSSPSLRADLIYNVGLQSGVGGQTLPSKSNYAGNSFLTGSAPATLNSISLYLGRFKFGSSYPSGTLALDIYTAKLSTSPGLYMPDLSTKLATASVSVSSLSTESYPSTATIFNYTGVNAITLSANTNYAFYLNATGVYFPSGGQIAYRISNATPYKDGNWFSGGYPTGNGSGYDISGQIDVTTAVPEPGTLILTGSALLAGAIGVYFTRRHRDQALTPTAV